MGMSTNLKADIELKSIEEIGPEAHGALTALFSHVLGFDIENTPREERPNHPFWGTKRFYRLGGQGYTERYDNDSDEQVGEYQHPLVKVRASVNHGWHEVHLFLDWLAPYVKAMPEEADLWDENQDIDIRRSFVFEHKPDGQGEFFSITRLEISGGFFGTETETTKEPLQVRINGIKRNL